MTGFQPPSESDIILTTILKTGLVDMATFLGKEGFRVSIGSRHFDLTPEDNFSTQQRLWVAKTSGGGVICSDPSIYNSLRELRIQLLIE